MPCAGFASVTAENQFAGAIGCQRARRARIRILRNEHYRSSRCHICEAQGFASRGRKPAKMDFCESVHGVLAGFTYAYAATATPATAGSDATVASRNATVAHAGNTQMARRTEPAPLYWYASSSRWRRVAIATAPLDGLSHCLRQWRSFSRTPSAASHAGVGAPQTAHQRRYRAHDETGSRKRQLRGFAAERG